MLNPAYDRVWGPGGMVASELRDEIYLVFAEASSATTLGPFGRFFLTSVLTGGSFKTVHICSANSILYHSSGSDEVTNARSLVKDLKIHFTIDLRLQMRPVDGQYLDNLVVALDRRGYLLPQLNTVLMWQVITLAVTMLHAGLPVRVKYSWFCPACGLASMLLYWRLSLGGCYHFSSFNRTDANPQQVKVGIAGGQEWDLHLVMDETDLVCAARAMPTVAIRVAPVRGLPSACPGWA